MTIVLGKLIQNALQRSKPVLLNGKPRVNADAIFSLKNPFILEVIPESRISELSLLEGKKNLDCM